MPPKRRRLAQPISESEDDGDGSDFSDAPPPPKRAKRGKGATGKSATAKGKAKEAVPKIVPKFGLHKLPEMPLDIVFEVRRVGFFVCHTAHSRLDPRVSRPRRPCASHES